MTKILIATGIYPPDIGGPAQYAKNLAEEFRKQGNEVRVKVFGKFQKYPWGMRHILFFFHILPAVFRADVIFTLEAFSSGIVTIASKIFFKKVIFRTGGDLLWESYVERTGDKVLLKDFYKTRLNKFSFKEKIIFSLMRWTLKNISAVIWSTRWQRDIFMEPYGLKNQKNFIVENYYGKKEESFEPQSKVFIASTRSLKWKNIDILDSVFKKVNKKESVELFTKNLPFPEFMDKIKNSYAVIQVSLGDISPNMILDAIRHNKPFICTKEVGIFDRIKDVGIFVDPLNETEIEEAILRLLDKNEYEQAVAKVKNFSFTHTWQEIAEEFLAVYKNLK